MAQDPIRMTEGFRKANVKAGQLTEEDANGEWQWPLSSSGTNDDEFLEILKRVSRPISPGRAG
jgi:hypothetical protein